MVHSSNLPTFYFQTEINILHIFIFIHTLLKDSITKSTLLLFFYMALHMRVSTKCSQPNRCKYVKTFHRTFIRTHTGQHKSMLHFYNNHQRKSERRAWATYFHVLVSEIVFAFKLLFLYPIKPNFTSKLRYKWMLNVKYLLCLIHSAFNISHLNNNAEQRVICLNKASVSFLKK
jgi:hypothetical protein